MEQLGHESVSMWDADTAGSGLICITVTSTLQDVHAVITRVFTVELGDGSPQEEGPHELSHYCRFPVSALAGLGQGTRVGD